MNRALLRHVKYSLKVRSSILPLNSGYPSILVNKARIRSQLKIGHNASRAKTTRSFVQLQSGPKHIQQASWNPWLVLCILASGAAVGIEYVTTRDSEDNPKIEGQAVQEEPIPRSQLDDELSSLFTAMASPPGTLGNLSAEQEQRLKEFWAITLKTFGIQDPSDVGSAGSARPITPADAPAPVESESAKKKEKHGLFHRKHKDNSSTSSSPGIGSSNDPEDKYGQTRDLQAILAAAKPEDLRASFWSMVKNDHPDTLLLRFLRARKWDVQRALAMLVSTMHWRRTEMHVDDDVMFYGEGGALRDSQSSDPNVKREGADFLQQLRLGKSFLHGVDKEGRPLCFVRVRLHRGGEQSERAMERYTVYVIETCRLALTPPVETAVSIHLHRSRQSN